MINQESIELTNNKDSCSLDNIHKLFKDRDNALKEVINLLPLKEMIQEKWTILALSTGGVYFANEIAKKTSSDFDFIFTEPITAPNNKDCYVAMVSETEEIVINEPLIKSFEINLDYIYGSAKRKHEEKILSYIYKYRKGEMIRDLKGKKVLLVDDGIDTGITLMCAIKTILQLKATSVCLATPVMALDTYQYVDSIIDDVYCVHTISNFIDVDFYYQNLENLDYEDVMKLIEKGK
jgi:putative phosphoribosyl transferase